MGYWGEHIMDGDLPLDLRNVLLEHISVINDDGDIIDNPSPSIAERLTTNQEQLLKVMRSYKFVDEEEKDIPILVLGVTMMNYGATFNKKVRSAVTRSCRRDHLAQSSPERRLYLKWFEELLSTYNNTPTEEALDINKMFGVTEEEEERGPHSKKVALMALHCVHHTYINQIWFYGVTLAYSRGGYKLLMGVHMDQTNVNTIIKEVKGIFDVPIVFIPADYLNLEDEDDGLYKTKGTKLKSLIDPQHA